MHLVARSADVGLDHAVHHGVEIADPRQLHRLVGILRPLEELPVLDHDGRLDALAVELRRDAEDDAENAVARLAHLQVPHQPQLLPQAEFAVEFADQAVQVGNGDEKSDRLFVEIGEENDVGVDDRFHLPDHLQRLLLRHRLDAREQGPRLVVNDAETLGGLLQIVHVDVLDPVTRHGVETLGAGENLLVGLRIVHPPDKTVLIEVILKTIVFEQLLVIGRIVGILVEGLEFVALDQQPPPVAPLSEVDRAVHGLHAAAGQPHARGFEQHVGDLLVVDRLEEPAAARGLLLDRSLLAVVERRDAADKLAPGVARHPADGLAVGEKFVFRRVENLEDIHVQRADPVAVSLIDSFRKVQPLALQGGSGDLLQGIFLLVHLVLRLFSAFPISKVTIFSLFLLVEQI